MDCQLKTCHRARKIIVMQTSQGKQKVITFLNIIWNGNIVNILFTRLAITFNIHLTPLRSVISAVGSQGLAPGH